MGYTHYRKISWIHCCLIYLGSRCFLRQLHPPWTTTAWTSRTAVIRQKWMTPRNGILQLHESVHNNNDNDTTTKTTVEPTKTTPPFAIVVQAEIVPDRLDEFLQLIEHNAIQSRLEPECLRFDVIQSQEQSNVFFFYEIYKNNHSAMDHHKSQAHYQAWADFKLNGGTISSTTYKTNGLFLTNHSTWRLTIPIKDLKKNKPTNNNAVKFIVT